MGADFLFDETNVLLKNLKDAGVKVITIICDGNRVNQSFFKKFETINPWRKKNNLLLFDFVHLLKNIRNTCNWITEATQELEFYDYDKKLVAKWSDIKNCIITRAKNM